jgi:hypothetical protein
MKGKFSIVGVEHRETAGVRAGEIIRNTEPGTPVRLVREPTNVFDPRAIQVWIGDQFVGYIPKKQNAALAAFIDAHPNIIAYDSKEMSVVPCIDAKFIRSPNSGYPMVEVGDE